MSEASLVSDAGRGRVPLVDALRGFALLGVVASNMIIMLVAFERNSQPSRLDIALGETLTYLLTGKFLALFSLLFGVSFGLYLRRASEAGLPVVADYLRRMLALLLIGAAHRAFSGTDILMTYAVLGAVLLLFRNAPDRVLLLAAVLALGLPELWRTFETWIGYIQAPSAVSRAERTRLAMEGQVIELLRVRALMMPRIYATLIVQSFTYLPLFLLGLWAARRRLLDSPEENRRLLWKILAGALVLTVLGNAAQLPLREAINERGRLIGIAFGITWHGTTFVHAIAYGAAFALLWQTGGKMRDALAFLAPAGRMALTNYLAVSIIGLIAIATGMYGRAGVPAAFALGVALWLGQLLWSRWWLGKFRLGPFEWLWRKLSFTSREFETVPPAAHPLSKEYRK